MKVALVGNQDNIAYHLCKWMRKEGVDAHVFLIRRDRDMRSQPQLVDPQVAQIRPEWLHDYDEGGAMWLLRSPRRARRIEDAHDVVVTCGASGLVVASHFRRAPVMHVTLGSEVSDFSQRLWKWNTPLAWRGVSLLSRRGLRRARAIITTGYAPELAALRRLDCLAKVRLWAMPADFDTNLGRIDQDLSARLRLRYDGCNKVFMWLSRLNFLDPSAHNYKAPEKFLEAFGQVIAQGKWNVRAVIGDHGTDNEAFKTLVREQGLEDHIDFVPHLSFTELLTYANLPNAVVFDYITPRGGGLYGLDREALSVGAVLVKAIDPRIVGLLFGDGCPILSVTDAQSCRQAMTRLLECTQEQFETIRRDYALWARGHVHYVEPVRRFVRMLNELDYCARAERQAKGRS
ncbi:MAG: glycosyltransferase [Rhodopirellula sp.]|nr:glycosyltransferase [Rhodopirellula sp.]